MIQQVSQNSLRINRLSVLIRCIRGTPDISRSVHRLRPAPVIPKAEHLAVPLFGEPSIGWFASLVRFDSECWCTDRAASLTPGALGCNFPIPCLFPPSCGTAGGSHFGLRE